MAVEPLLKKQLKTALALWCVITNKKHKSCKHIWSKCKCKRVTMFLSEVAQANLSKKK
jgi:hypothetical protein